jgi:Endonuclease/Exonuclease/phosphatase family
MSELPGAVEAEKAPPLRRRRRRLGPVGAGLLVIGWLIVAVLGLLVVLRLVAWDAAEPLMVLNALTQLVYLPAWVVAAVALVARRWWLGAAAVVIVAAQLVFVLPELTAAAPLPAWAGHAATIRVLDANLDSAHAFYPGYVQAIEQDQPDLVSFEEFTPDAEQGMAQSGMLARFPYRCVAPNDDAAGFLLASRIRMTGCRFESVQWDGQAFNYLVEATLWSSAGPVDVRLFHDLAPLPSSWTETRSTLADANRMVQATGPSHMLMLGDFNSSWGNLGLVRLLHDGLTDGAAARGKALDMTWPNGAAVPPFVRIDHVLTGTRLAVTQITAKPGFGSDHRLLDATVAIRG